MDQLQFHLMPNNQLKEEFLDICFPFAETTAVKTELTIHKGK